MGNTLEETIERELTNGKFKGLLEEDFNRIMNKVNGEDGTIIVLNYDQCKLAFYVGMTNPDYILAEGLSYNKSAQFLKEPLTEEEKVFCGYQYFGARLILSSTVNDYIKKHKYQNVPFNCEDIFDPSKLNAYNASNLLNAMNTTLEIFVLEQYTYIFNEDYAEFIREHNLEDLSIKAECTVERMIQASHLFEQIKAMKNLDYIVTKADL